MNSSAIGRRFRVSVACGVVLLCVTATGLSQPAPVTVALQGSSVVPAELTDPKYLYEIVRHVYRWHLDENDLDRLSGVKEFQFWIRLRTQPLDGGDHSRIAEITMPLVGTTVTVKKPDYRIDELDLTVTGKTFRITNVSKLDIPVAPLASDRVVSVSYADMREYLFKTRAEATFPDDALRERLRVAVRKEIGLHPTTRTAGRQITHVAPLSPVSNEVWVYWENRQLLIRFASDIDLVNPAIWEHETLMVKTWDVRTQVVVSLDEAAGSNAFMTRNQIGRALYNCIVLGQRQEVTNPATAPGKNAPSERL